MEPIAASDALHPGDVVHHPAFGFAVLTSVDDRGALLRWQRQQGSPQRVSRRTLGNIYHRAKPGGILARSVVAPEALRAQTRADPLAALGQLILEYEHGLEIGRMERWMLHLVGDEGFGEWIRALTELASADPRFQFANHHFRLAPGVGSDDLAFRVEDARTPEPARARAGARERRKGRAVPPDRVAAADAFGAGRALAVALAQRHAAGQSVDRADGAIVPRGAGWSLDAGAAFDPRADVAAAARALLSATVGALPSAEAIDDAELCDLVAGVAADLPVELLAVLQQALGGDPALRLRDGGELAVSLGVAEAVHRARTELPPRLGAGLCVGFDTHIGTVKALLGQVNQDHFLLVGDPDLACFVVADGISTASAGSGDLASSLLVRAIRLHWATHMTTLRGAGPEVHHAFLGAALERANAAICQAASRLAGGHVLSQVPMGTTVVAGTSSGNRVHLAALGDSRAWLVGRHGAAPLIHDHNLNFQLLEEVVQGQSSTHSEGGYALIGYAGHFDEDGRPVLPPAFTRTVALLPGEWIVLATDGFSDYAAEGAAAVSRVVAETCASVGRNPSSADAMAVARKLVSRANAGGGGDNITVLALTLGAAAAATSEPS